MWKLLLAVGCVGPLLAAPVPKDFKKADDKAMLLGAWVVVGTNVSGQVRVGGTPRTYYFDGGKVRAESNGRDEFIHAYTLDPANKRMAWASSQPREYPCAYTLTADRLVIAVGHQTDYPPSVNPGPFVTIYECKRASGK